MFQYIKQTNQIKMPSFDTFKSVGQPPFVYVYSRNIMSIFSGFIVYLQCFNFSEISKNMKIRAITATYLKDLRVLRQV